MALPTEIRLDRATRVLHVSFDDGTQFALPAEYLRVESPSAEVQGHNPGQKQTVAGRRHVGKASPTETSSQYRGRDPRPSSVS